MCLSEAASDQQRDSLPPELWVEKETGEARPPPASSFQPIFFFFHAFSSHPPTIFRLSTREEETDFFQVPTTCQFLFVSYVYNPHPSPVRLGVILPVLQVEKLRLQKVKQLVQNHFIERTRLETKLTLI